jgi:hypothetical protein
MMRRICCLRGQKVVNCKQEVNKGGHAADCGVPFEG